MLALATVGVAVNFWAWALLSPLAAKFATQLHPSSFQQALLVVLSVVIAGAVVQAFTPPLVPLGTIAFLAMAAALGAGSGATFALVAAVAPANQVGSVTGVVGAAGGLGGFVPPLIMGAIYGNFRDYGLGLALLAVVALAALLLDVFSVSRSARTATAA